MLAETWTFGSFLGYMIVLFFWMMAIWIFIAIFGDIFHRSDIHGGAKAGWILLIFIVPIFGALIYIIARPKNTPQDKADRARMEEAQRRPSGVSTADEIAKLSKLRDEGKITADEFEEMKKRSMAPLQ